MGKYSCPWVISNPLPPPPTGMSTCPCHPGRGRSSVPTFRLNRALSAFSQPEPSGPLRNSRPRSRSPRLDQRPPPPRLEPPPLRAVALPPLRAAVFVSTRSLLPRGFVENLPPRAVSPEER